eukprot:CAMPEP_0198572344 /NCGR_PEP_ID=MMETSP1462-20131121/111699_1 /TAXON_ID=1333877 /ORGANISM="Brandtodinium nutriculum, Strain RCC3387" /LENGTH=78 /DNA_ID=CAMNT_0044303497 /DNA_START=72 /DNA_END=305 /DNA_ORIENTATION=+
MEAQSRYEPLISVAPSQSAHDHGQSNVPSLGGSFHSVRDLYKQARENLRQGCVGGIRSVSIDTLGGPVPAVAFSPDGS